MIDTFTLIQRLSFFGLLLVISGIFIWLLRDFAMPVFWAVVFAVMLYPLFLRIRSLLNDRGALASLLTIILTLIVVFAPLYVIGQMVVNETIDAYLALADRDFQIAANPSALPLVPDIANLLLTDARTIGQHIAEFVQSTSAWLATQIVSIGTNTFTLMLKFALMLYLLFFFLKDGARLGNYFLRILPLGNIREHMLFGKFVSTTRAIMKGTIIVAIVQGFAGALLFLIVGIPSPALWGVAMALFALIPAIGPGIIWAPVGVALLLTGNMIGGVIILIGGAFLIGLLDNILRPLLVGRDTQMPDALILLSILGGLASFGIAGVVIGPVIAALFLSIWELFATEFATELEERG